MTYTVSPYVTWAYWRLRPPSLSRPQNAPDRIDSDVPLTAVIFLPASICRLGSMSLRLPIPWTMVESPTARWVRSRGLR